MDSFSLRCEDKVLQLEKEGKENTPEYLDLADFLVELKSMLALYIESLLPDSDFAETEFEQYDEEAFEAQHSESYNWRKKLCKEMQSLYSDADEVKEAESSDDIDSDMLKITLEEVAEQAIDNYKNSSANSILDRYTPKSTNPIDFSTVAGMEDVKLKLIEEARENNIIVIVATNKYNMLDEAFKARFDGQMYFPLPNTEQIERLLKKTLSARAKGVELAESEDEIRALAKMLKGYSNRSIVFITDEASKLARRNNRQNIYYNDFKQAINECELEQSDEKDYKTKKVRAAVGFSF